MTDAPRTMLDHALLYARHGWPVFPCNPRQDPPDTPSGKRRSKQPMVRGADKDAAGNRVPKSGGLWRATTDEAQITKWWRRNPGALIGVPTGSWASGVFVIDLDPHGEPVEAVLARLVEAVGALPEGPVSETQSGGRHYWFALPETEAEMPRNSAKRLEGVDWRGDGGYVIAPPSVMSDGAKYTWLVRPKEMAFPQATPAMLDLVYQRGKFARGHHLAHASSRGRERLRGGGLSPDGRSALPPSGRSSEASGQAPQEARGDDRGHPEERERRSASKASAAPVAPERRNNTRRDGESAGDFQVRRYCEAALDNAVAKVAGAAQGQRGHTLNATAFSLGPFVALGVLSESDVRAALRGAADASGLTATDGANERNAKIDRGLSAGAADRAALEGRLAEIRDEAERASQRRSSHSMPHRPAAPQNIETDGSQARSDGRGSGDGGGGGDGGQMADDEPDPAVLAQCALEPQNDTGNARRLNLHFGADMLNVREVGEHRWTGTHWEPIGGGHAFERFAQATAERIDLEAFHIHHSKTDALLVDKAEQLAEKARDELTPEDKALLASADAAAGRLRKRRADRRRFAVSSGNRARTEAMCKQLLPHITVEPEALDADPLAINVENGTLRFHRAEVEDPECPDPDVRRVKRKWICELQPHAREDLIAKCMPVVYDPLAQCPRWDAFMEKFQPGDHIHRFLQRFHGYAMTGLMGEQVMVFNYGGGSNGKSTFMEALARLMGNYAQVLPSEALTGDQQRRGDQATPEFARLPGARMVRCAELKRGERFREAALKQMTGGEPMLVRHLNKGFFELHPGFKLIGSGNDKPTIGGVDEGIWRRIKLVPWLVKIGIEERRPFEKVQGEFTAERSGILNWLIEGLLDYLEGGLRVPAEVAEATDTYRHEQDPVGEFLDSHVRHVPDPSADVPGPFVTARAMYEAYEGWCHENSVKPYSEKYFSSIMEQKGMAKKRGRVRTYLNVELVDPPAPPHRKETMI